jgi:disulfide bond formation protein DsbB
MDRSKNLAAAIAATVSTLLLAGALAFQAAGYAPCEMCLWQRWPHAAASALGACALQLHGRPGRLLALAAAACVAASGALGAFHAGVEWRLWEGVTTCATSVAASGGDVLVDIMKAPMVRCDEPAWRLAGVSMAGYNALASLLGATASLAVLTKGFRTSRQEGERE